jgi:hypothetical protein
MTPFCGNCRTFMRSTKTGRNVMTTMADGSGYQIFAGDEFTCAKCQTRVVVNFGKLLTEHWRPDFGQWKEELEAHNNLFVEVV